MQTFVNRHFLSAKDSIRFVLFVAASLFLVVLGAANKSHTLQLLPAENQIIDSKPKQSVLPHMEPDKRLSAESEQA